MPSESRAMQGTYCEHFKRPRTHTGKQSGERRVKQRIAINAKVNLARERSYLASQVRFRVQPKLSWTGYQYAINMLSDLS